MLQWDMMVVLSTCAGRPRAGIGVRSCPTRVAHIAITTGQFPLLCGGVIIEYIIYNKGFNIARKYYVLHASIF